MKPRQCLIVGLIITVGGCSSPAELVTTVPATADHAELTIFRQNWGGGAGGTDYEIYYGNSDNRVLILSGTGGHPVRARWIGPALAVIEQCGGNVRDFVSSTWKNANRSRDDYMDTERVSFQVIFHPGFTSSGQQFCVEGAAGSN